jgi:hypothetical protein
MNWNYRVIEEDGTVSIREVHYEDGKPTLYSELPTGVISTNGRIGLAKVLDMMSAALSKPVLKPEDFRR